ncbi:ester cyclase [Phormidium tenue FACHB-886]|nr:ester cyclase [Phormidium tenue FACHB-886]
MVTNPNSDHNKALYQRYIQQVFNQGQLDVLDEILSPSYVYHEAPPGTPPGAEGIKQVVSIFRTAFPDLEITIDDQVAEDDKVCSRATTRGTHQGEIFGIPATGKAVTMTGLTLVRIVDGRIVESWVKNDVMALMNQLGASSVSE